MNKMNIDDILKKHGLYPDQMKNIVTKDGKPGNQLERTQAAIKEIVEAVIDKCEQMAEIKEVKKVEPYDYANISNYGIDSKSILKVKQMIDYE